MKATRGNSLTLRLNGAVMTGYTIPFVLIQLLVLNLSLSAQGTNDFVQSDPLNYYAEIYRNNIHNNINSDYLITLSESDRDKVKPSIDLKLFREINSSRSKFKDGFFNVFDRSMLPVTLILPAAAFTYGRLAEKTYDENTGYLLGISVVTDLAITVSLKYTIKRKRPRDFLNNVYTRNEHTDRYSFPSGHTSLSFTSAGMFVLRYPEYPQVYLPMYGWAIAIAYARPYFGMHYPSDLIAGALIGTGSSVLIYSLRTELLKLKNNVLNESKSDEGSINGGTLTIFAGSFILSTLINEFMIKYDNRVRFNVLPGSQGMRLNINWHMQ